MTSNLDLEILEVSAHPLTSSKAATSRRKSKRKTKGGRAGNQSIFTPKKQEYLGEYLDRFISLRNRPRAAQNKFWVDVFAGYWERFPWFIPFLKDPEDDSDLVEPEGMVTDLEEKGKIIKRTQDRIRAHLRYRRTVMTRNLKDPWAFILQELCQQVTPDPPPRTMSLAQLYMSKYKDAVEEEFCKRWPTAELSDSYKLTFRCSIASEMLTNAPDSVKKGLEAELQEIKAAEEAFAAQEAQEAEHLPVGAQTMARESMARVIQPMLDFLRKKTGFYLTLIAGIPNEDGPREFQLKVVTAGKTAGNIPLPWHMVEPESFKTQVMGSFTRFLSQTSEFAAREAVLGRSRGRTPSAPRATPLVNPNSSESLTQLHQTDLLALPRSSTSTPGLPALNLPLQPPPEPSASKLPNQSGGRKQATTSGDKSGKKDKKRQRNVDADESDSAQESDDKLESDKWQNEEDEVEDGEEDEDDGENQALLLAPEVPKDAVIPTMDELKLNAPVREFLSRLDAPMRRKQLYCLKAATEYDRNVMVGKIFSRELLRQIGAVQLTSESKKKKKGKDSSGGRQSGGGKDKGKRPALEVRRTSRRKATGATLVAPPTMAPNHSSPDAASTNLAHDPLLPPLNTSSSSQSLNYPASSLLYQVASPLTLHDPPPVSASVLPGASSSSTVPPVLSPVLPLLPPPSTQSPDTDHQLAPPTISLVRSLEHEVVSGNNSLAPSGSPPSNLPSSIVLDESGWPDWLKLTFNWMEGRRSSLGPDFMSAVEWWTVIERSYDWKSSTKGYSTQSRPEQVGNWLRVLRADVSKVPAIEDLAQYSEQWWSWWSDLQPDWRERDDAGRPTIGGTGSWDALKRPGKNGFRIVLLSLAWWGLEIANAATNGYDEGARKEWLSAAREVQWVSSQMATWAISERKRPSDNVEGSTQPAKRRRR